MNNFNDYYNYLNNNYNDMNFMTDSNNMIYDMNTMTAFPNTFMMPNNNISDNSNITDSQTGFKRGNLFNNLYSEYKNYKPNDLKANSEREDLIMQIDEQRFAIIEMNLYLDIYPNDKNALNKFNNYLRKEKELINLYESKYGPMTISSPVQTDNWLWNNSPWPWEVQN
ncbi:MAG: spore coat protein CotJB [Bacilli bacterium]